MLLMSLVGHLIQETTGPGGVFQGIEEGAAQGLLANVLFQGAVWGTWLVGVFFLMVKVIKLSQNFGLWRVLLKTDIPGLALSLFAFFISLVQVFVIQDTRSPQGQIVILLSVALGLIGMLWTIFNKDILGEEGFTGQIEEIFSSLDFAFTLSGFVLSNVR